MHIQWFPGHMTKSLRMMTDNIKLVDMVVYVLDSRAVYSSINPAFDSVIGSKPRLYVLNKADLAEAEATRQWVKYFADKGIVAVTATGTSPSVVSLLKKNILKIMQEKINFYKNKGVSKVVRAMVIGVPNSGKSTIINSLCKKKRTATGDKAGVTVGKQWVKVDEFLEVLDTPGTLCPAFENQTVGKHLAYIGSINDDILDASELCLEFIKELCEKNPSALMQRYGIANIKETPLEVYEDICARRGFILKRGEFDYERCAKAVIDDFRKGRLGQISLEKVGDDIGQDTNE